MDKPRFLIVRFSSIGDIVLTTPILRNIRQAYPNAEIHYVLKKNYVELLQYNPDVDVLHAYDGNWETLVRSIKKYHYNYQIDLHKSLRSLRLRRALGGKWYSFPKENFKKWLMVRFKRHLSIPHIVERYAKVLQDLNIPFTKRRLYFFIPESLQQWAASVLYYLPPPRVAVVLSATYTTKQWLPKYFITFLNRLNWSVVFLGGIKEYFFARQITPHLRVPFMDFVGKASLLQSTALMQQCQRVLTHDTGFMHIAAALQMPILSLWGNTVPAFGMTPYATTHVIAEVQGLKCRPCSKLGFRRCPKRHFKCMRLLTPEKVFVRWQQLQDLLGCQTNHNDGYDSKQ